MVPRVKHIRPSDDYVLHVTFDNGITKLYDMKSKLTESRYALLVDKIIFKMVKIDCGGYGISWNDQVDMSENELWIHGR